MGIGNRESGIERRKIPPRRSIPLFRLPIHYSRFPALPMSDHIVRSFDEELTQLNSAIAHMGELSQKQLAGALDSLLLRDTTVAAHVVKGDLEVDELERELDARAIRVIALRQPIARDLREVLAALRIGIEFERVC